MRADEDNADTLGLVLQQRPLPGYVEFQNEIKAKEGKRKQRKEGRKKEKEGKNE